MSASPDRQQYREVLASLAAKTKTKIPELNGRVEKALKLALLGDVELHDNGTATVYSSSDPTRRYEIIEGTCTCRDWEQAPQHLCQHRLSAGLVRRTYALLSTTTPAPADSAAAEHSTTPAPVVPLPEAPASVNVRLHIGGREVQWTLRDTAEARLAPRLEALLARYPVAPPQGQGQPLSPQQHNALAMHRPVTGRCPVHNVPMHLNTKEGHSWWSHRTADGQWCKGR